MPRVCSVCQHEQRQAIDLAVASGEANRRIAAQFGVGESALRRHKATHLPEVVVKAAQQQELTDAIDVLKELQRCFNRINMLFDSCHEWLQDPDDPTRYTLEPRDHELTVIYVEVVDDKPVRKREALSVLLAQIKGKTVVRWETKHADPRDLILKTAAQLNSQLQLVSDLMHREQLIERLEALEARLGRRRL